MRAGADDRAVAEVVAVVPGPQRRRRPRAAARGPRRSAGRIRATSSKPRTVASIASCSWAISHSSLTSSQLGDRVGQLAVAGAGRSLRPSYGQDRRVDRRVEAAQHPGAARRAGRPAPPPGRSRSAVSRPSSVGLLARACAGGRPTARRSGCGRTRRCPGTSAGGCRAIASWPDAVGPHAPARCRGRARRSGRRSRCPGGTGSRCRWPGPSRCRSGSPASRRGTPPTARRGAWRGSGASGRGVTASAVVAPAGAHELQELLREVAGRATRCPSSARSSARDPARRSP